MTYKFDITLSDHKTVIADGTFECDMTLEEAYRYDDLKTRARRLAEAFMTNQDVIASIFCPKSERRYVCVAKYTTHEF